ncbi:MAG TPA: response regulator [Steroidobacteraceae bacterium]|nr:response regulator [Steroidobacteraceae bacterium]
MKNARLMVVDDEVSHMRALCDTLGFEGYRVTGFDSPAQALHALSESECDLLLTDLMMPEMDGIELIQAAREVNPDIAAVIMTGHGTIDTAVAALQTGALDYVLKPFRLNVILPVLARALDLRNLRIENASLQKREREQALKLAAAYRDLESFSYSISHDLRSPLRAIRGMTQIYMEENGSTLSDSGRGRLDQVVAGAERMDQMIDDLLRFCRVTHCSPGSTRIDLNAIVARLIDELKVAEPQRKVDLSIDPLPDCDGDPGLIEQVLANLLSNAFKFTRARADARIEVGTYRAENDGDDEQVYFVRDNGAGFNMKYAAKLFGVFQRLHSQEQFPGTGVGLSIVKRILERHGGRIWAESEPGQGATFFFVVGRTQ